MMKGLRVLLSVFVLNLVACQLVYSGSLYDAVLKGNLKEVEKILPSEKKDVNQGRWPDRLTPLHVAVWKGHGEIVELLLSAGADVNLQDKWGLSPLHYAILNGRPEVVKRLTATKEININITGPFALTPLHMAVDKGDIEVAKILIERGANVNVAGSNGFVPLRYAVRENSVSMIQMLYHHGAQPIKTVDFGILDTDDLSDY